MHDYLLIDVGNGRAKLGLATREAITAHHDLATKEISASALQHVIADWDFRRVVVCSVVPDVMPVLRGVFGSAMIELRHDTAMGIGIDYPKPETIGPDRLANAVALSALYCAEGQPGIVIDFGTAVTFDILSARHHYIGGIIAPGLRLMTDYLHERTALLPRVELREPESAIGQSTESAILAGAAIGYRGMVAGLLAALRKELPGGKDAAVVATGGDAHWITSGMTEHIATDPDLTLHGLRLVGNRA